jgi:hypothetical protein
MCYISEKSVMIVLGIKTTVHWQYLSKCKSAVFCPLFLQRYLHHFYSPYSGLHCMVDFWIGEWVTIFVKPSMYVLLIFVHLSPAYSFWLATVQVWKWFVVPVLSLPNQRTWMMISHVPLEGGLSDWNPGLLSVFVLIVFLGSSYEILKLYRNTIPDHLPISFCSTISISWYCVVKYVT